MDLIPYPGQIVAGSVRFDGRDLASLSWSELRQLRGRQMAMICPDPINGLNPVLTIGQQVEEMITNHLHIDK